jgi:hypothetical protein
VAAPLASHNLRTNHSFVPSPMMNHISDDLLGSGEYPNDLCRHLKAASLARPFTVSFRRKDPLNTAKPALGSRTRQPGSQAAGENWPAEFGRPKAKKKPNKSWALVPLKSSSFPQHGSARCLVYLSLFLACSCRPK